MSTTISDLEILTDMLGDQTIHDEEERIRNRQTKIILSWKGTPYQKTIIR